LDAHEDILTKLDVREFSSKNVPASVKLKVLEAGRMAGSGMNVQHWRFLLVQEPKNLSKLAGDSTSGKWVEGANFAVIVLTNPKYGFHLIDAGRSVQNMQLAAWAEGVVSCIYTGMNREAMEKDFNIPHDLSPSVVVGFGYPAKKLVGRKDRKPLKELAFHERYGDAVDPKRIEA
jgi:nitroreductase